VATLPAYLALKQVRGGRRSWMAERELVARHDWGKNHSLTAEAMEKV